MRLDARERIRGLYGIADAEASGDPLALLDALLAGGCRLVQLRCKGWSRADLLVAARLAVARCRAVGATLIVNDDAEVAREADADGVHGGQLDASADDLRRIVGPDRIVGRSTHDVDQVRAALVGADYVAFGPIWSTPHLSRPKPVRGVDRLAAVRAIVPAGVPLVAIGGITVDRLPEVRAAGVDAWAVIGAIAHAPDRIAATRALSAPS